MKRLLLFGIIFFVLGFALMYSTLSYAHLLCFSEYSNRVGNVVTVEELYDTKDDSYTELSSQKTGMQTATRWVVKLIEPLSIPSAFEQEGKTLWEVEVVGTTMAPGPYFNGNTQCGNKAHWVGINRPSWGDMTYTSYAWIENSGFQPCFGFNCE